MKISFANYDNYIIYIYMLRYEFTWKKILLAVVYLLIMFFGPYLLKWFFHKYSLFIDESEIKRPKRAGECFTCGPVMLYNIDSDNNKINEQTGMPSGHVFQATFSVYIFIFMLLCEPYNSKAIFRIFLILLSIAYIIATIVSRVFLHCHTVKQCLFGFVTGTILAFLFLMVTYATYSSS
jgi:membrane-associated phospholipid phosphatase